MDFTTYERYPEEYRMVILKESLGLQRKKGKFRYQLYDIWIRHRKYEF